MSNSTIIPFSLLDAPALIEHLLPVQKLSIEVYKERISGTSQTLTALGNFWKGRKPLILNKACLLGCLLPATDHLQRDLEVFELLMGMDEKSLQERLEEKNSKQSRFFLNQDRSVRIDAPYHDWVREGCRPDECGDSLFNHIWNDVNTHLGTHARSFSELIEQLGIMRFGHRPRVADTFCGSGQIPFEAARLGCDVYASDLNPVACMLTWGAFNIIGAPTEHREEFKKSQAQLIAAVQNEVDALGIESDGLSWKARSFVYCVEVRCPQTDWKVPLLPSRVLSEDYGVIAELIPVPLEKRYEIRLRLGATSEEIDIIRN